MTLNGQSLGQAANAFRHYRWPVKPMLRDGENVLHISFRSPVQYITEQQELRAMLGVSEAIDGARGSITNGVIMVMA